MKIMKKNKLQIGMIGCGVIGSNVFDIISKRHADVYKDHLVVKSIIVRDIVKKRDLNLLGTKISNDISDVIKDNEIDLVIELMGGEEIAFDYISKCLMSGKHVVTANKEVIAKRGSELFKIANNNSVELRYEASVGGGIPIISSLGNDFSSNKIIGIRAIINGTTYYILTRMSNGTSPFSEILKDAQKLGYAETDPTADVEAFDPVYKIIILTNLAFGINPDHNLIYREGISDIKSKEFIYAKELGFAIKLIASAQKFSKKLLIRVHPALIPKDIPMANVNSA